MKKTRFGAMLIIVAAFLLGSIAGYAVSSLLHTPEEAVADESPYGDLTEYLKNRLRMDEEQQERYDKLLQSRRETMSEIHSDCRSKFRTQIDSLRRETRAILNEEQLGEYERFIDEFEAHREETRGRGKDK
jgi:Spy/CpxP family protein refolding chaperone